MLAAAAAVSGCTVNSGQAADSAENDDGADSRLEAVAAAAAPAPATGAGSLDTPNPALRSLAGSSAVDRDLIVPVDDLALLAEAREELISRCMQRRGFQYTPISLESAPLSGPLDGLDMFWLQSLEQAQQWGYGGPSAFGNEDAPAGTPSAAHPDAEYLRELSPEERAARDAALTGAVSETTDAEATPAPDAQARSSHVEMRLNTDGCIGATEAAIYGDPSRLLQLESVVGSSIRGTVKARVKASAAFVAAVDAWQACMQQRGYEFADPQKAFNTVGRAYERRPPYDKLTLQEAMALEAEIATADGRCAEETGLFDVTESELVGAVEEVMAEREGEILGYREMIATAVDTAKALLASG